MSLELMPAGRGQDEVGQFLKDPLWALMAMVGLVLLIACGNVANLLIARATSAKKRSPFAFARSKPQTHRRPTVARKLVALCTWSVEGDSPKPDEDMQPWQKYVSPRYFETLKIPVCAGRGFTDRDTLSPARLLSCENFARHYFGNKSPSSGTWEWVSIPEQKWIWKSLEWFGTLVSKTCGRNLLARLTRDSEPGRGRSDRWPPWIFSVT